MSLDTDEVWNFLGSWFPDADLEGVSDDEQVTRNFMDVGDAGVIERVRRGLDELLALRVLPMDRVMDEANRSFDSEQECREWLAGCRKVLGAAAAR